MFSIDVLKPFISQLLFSTQLSNIEPIQTHGCFMWELELF